MNLVNNFQNFAGSCFFFAIPVEFKKVYLITLTSRNIPSSILCQVRDIRRGRDRDRFQAAKQISHGKLMAVFEQLQLVSQFHFTI